MAEVVSETTVPIRVHVDTETEEVMRVVCDTDVNHPAADVENVVGAGEMSTGERKAEEIRALQIYADDDAAWPPWSFGY